MFAQRQLLRLEDKKKLCHSSFQQPPTESATAGALKHRAIFRHCSAKLSCLSGFLARPETPSNSCVSEYMTDSHAIFLATKAMHLHDEAIVVCAAHFTLVDAPSYPTYRFVGKGQGAGADVDGLQWNDARWLIAAQVHRFGPRLR
jgi:hypothetical protein